jgi:hypothetical protein
MGKILQDLGLQRRAKPLDLLDAVVVGRRLELRERGDIEIPIEPKHLVRPQTGHRQHLEDAGWNLLPQLLEAGMRAIPM